MNADVKATCLAALDEHRSLLTVVTCLDEDHPDVAAIDKAKAALEVDAPSEAMVGVDGLLPCPFCGSQSVEIDNSDIGDASWAYCDGCGARSAASSDDSKVIAAWNKRALQRRAAGEGV